MIRVTAPPEGGKANAAVCELIANVGGVPKSNVAVLRASSRNKLVEVDGADEATLLRTLATVR